MNPLARRVLATAVMSLAVVAPSAAVAGSGDAVVMRVTVGLQRDTAGLQSLAAAVSNPTGPNYRVYPSVAHIAKRFGATSTTVAAVRRTLAKAGFTQSTLDATRGFLIVPTTASQIKALEGQPLEMARTVGSHRAQALADIRSGAGGLITEIVTTPLPVHPAATSAQASSGGLNWPAHTGTAKGCAQGVSTPVPPPANRAEFPQSTVFTPNQFQTAFGFDSLHRAGIQGQGQHIALFEVGAGIKAADFTTFAQCFGLPSPNLRVVPVGQAQPIDPLAAGDATTEAQLDVQAVMTSAPRARLTMLEGNDITSMPEVLSASLDARRMRGVPDVLSVSYGICEAMVQGGSVPSLLNGSASRRLSDWVLASAAGAGVSVLVSTGDSGAQGCAHAIGQVPLGPAVFDTVAFASANYVAYPASSPWATAVGGTSMTLTANNRIRSQVPWNDRVSIGLPPMAEGLIAGVPSLVFDAGGGTGGSSMLYGTPAWQRTAGITSTRRLVPDVSMFASRGVVMACSVYDAATATGPCPPDSASWPFMSVAGTSFAAPLLAGGVALANQRAELKGASRLGFVAPLLYGLGQSAVIDVTTGNNDVFGTGRCCFAGRGYDQATGLGTVNVARLADAAVRAAP